MKKLLAFVGAVLFTAIYETALLTAAYYLCPVMVGLSWLWLLLIFIVLMPVVTSVSALAASVLSYPIMLCARVTRASLVLPTVMLLANAIYCIYIIWFGGHLHGFRTVFAYVTLTGIIVPTMLAPLMAWKGDE